VNQHALSGPFQPTTQPTASHPVAPASIAPLDAPTLKMSNVFASGPVSRASARLLRRVQCQQTSRQADAKAKCLLHYTASLSLTTRPPAEPTPWNPQLNVMTGFNPD
jgi:hypothetical protein